MSRPWYAEGIRFECTRCHACCMARGEYVFVYLEQDELLAMAAELGLEPEEFRHLEGGEVQIRGDVLVRELNEFLGLDLPEGEADTAGGLVFGRMGRIGGVGDEVEVSGEIRRTQGATRALVIHTAIDVVPDRPAVRGKAHVQVLD